MPNEIRSITKAMRLLSFYSEEQTEYGVHELSRKMGVNKSTVHRILSTLEKGGFLYKNASTAKYRLGYKLYKLGNLVLPVKELREGSEVYLKELVEATGESVNLVALNGSEALYVNKVRGHYRMQLLERVGSTLPLHCTGVGKVLLAHMPPGDLEKFVKNNELKALTKNTITDIEALRKELKRVVEKGYAIDNGEYEIGCRCIAAPIRDYSGKVVAAVAISGTYARMTLNKVPAFAAVVIKCAQNISGKLMKSV